MFFENGGPLSKKPRGLLFPRYVLQRGFVQRQIISNTDSSDFYLEVVVTEWRELLGNGCDAKVCEVE